MPNPWVLPGAATLPVSLEVYADSPDAFKGTVLTLELAPIDRAPLARLPLSQKPGNDRDAISPQQPSRSRRFLPGHTL